MYLWAPPNPYSGGSRCFSPGEKKAVFFVCFWLCGGGGGGGGGCGWGVGGGGGGGGQNFYSLRQTQTVNVAGLMTNKNVRTSAWSLKTQDWNMLLGQKKCFQNWQAQYVTARSLFYCTTNICHAQPPFPHPPPPPPTPPSPAPQPPPPPPPISSRVLSVGQISVLG